MSKAKSASMTESYTLVTLGRLEHLCSRTMFSNRLSHRENCSHSQLKYERICQQDLLSKGLTKSLRDLDLKSARIQ